MCLEGAAEVGTAVSSAKQGGSGCPDLGEDLQGGVSGCHALPVRDVGNDTAYWEVWGRIPPQ